MNFIKIYIKLTLLLLLTTNIELGYSQVKNIGLPNTINYKRLAYKGVHKIGI